MESSSSRTWRAISRWGSTIFGLGSTISRWGSLITITGWWSFITNRGTVFINWCSVFVCWVSTAVTFGLLVLVFVLLLFLVESSAVACTNWGWSTIGWSRGIITVDWCSIAVYRSTVSLWGSSIAYGRSTIAWRGSSIWFFRGIALRWRIALGCGIPIIATTVALLVLVLVFLLFLRVEGSVTSTVTGGFRGSINGGDRGTIAVNWFIALGSLIWRGIVAHWSPVWATITILVLVFVLLLFLVEGSPACTVASVFFLLPTESCRKEATKQTKERLRSRVRRWLGESQSRHWEKGQKGKELK
jgi:hypothetical protein